MNAAADPEVPVVRCAVCTHVLHDPESRRRGIGPVCLLRLPGGWLLSWHRSPPRLGHVPAEIAEGQEALFPVQPMLPTDGEAQR